ncbi:hypothetical protein ACJ41O_003807 [Fusarium nematophilum]
MLRIFKVLGWSAWGPEIWAVLGSSASLVAMAVLLSRFDGKPVFAWNSVTLNAVVSILSVAIKAGLAYVTAECMAQWKWILFAREPRLLVDFDRIDNATRGPLGSLRVIFSTRGAWAVQFGAILTLLAIGLDPLAQQLVQLRNSIVFELSNSLDAGLLALNSRTTTYELGTATQVQVQAEDVDEDVYYSRTELPLSMQAAILNGFSRSPWEIEQEALVQCPTSNCTWDRFDTLGVCHRCTNLTSQLKRVDDFGDTLLTVKDLGYGRGGIFPATAFALPNGHFIANVDGCPPYNGIFSDCLNKKPYGIYTWDDRYAMTSFGTGNPNKTNSMKDIDTLIWSMSVIHPDVEYLNDTSFTPGAANDTMDKRFYWPDIPMQAMECSLYYCIKHVDSAIQGNQLREHITEAQDWRRDLDSWERTDNDDMPQRNTPPDDEVDSLEFNLWYSAAGYTDLRLERLGNNKTAEPMTVAAASVKSISHHMQDLFRGNWTNTTEIRKALEEKLGKGAVGFNGMSRGPDQDELTMEASPPAIDGVWTWKSTNMTRKFYTLATSMTNEMRRNSNPRLPALSGQDEDRYQGSLSQYGKVGTEEVLYDIQWPWMALHGFMLASVIVFLLITAGASGDPDVMPLARNSALATIRQGLQIGGVLEHADTMERMEKTARRSYVKIPRGQDDEAAACMRSRKVVGGDSGRESSPLADIEMETGRHGR